MTEQQYIASRYRSWLALVRERHGDGASIEGIIMSIAGQAAKDIERAVIDERCVWFGRCEDAISRHEEMVEWPEPDVKP